MAEDKDQAKPFAAVTDWTDEEENKPISSEYITRYHRKCIICCGCCAAILLIPIVVVLILMFTVFRVKDPILMMNYEKIEGLNALSDPSIRNLTFEAELSVKNPNCASFKFHNASTSVYYDTIVIGEVAIPDGRSRARETLRMNFTVDVKAEKILEVKRFKDDWVAGVLPISTYTGIKGKVKVLNVWKRRVLAGMDCKMEWNIKSQEIQNRTCKRRVSF